jgi:2-C-methyl-D-erythritol 4-phosphate cytidylyltransferase
MWSGTVDGNGGEVTGPGEVAAVVPAAGAGRRLGDQGAKALVRLHGRPLLAHALACLEASRCVTAIVVVASPEAEAATAQVVAAEGLAKVTAVVRGGPTRQVSVARGLAALPGGPGFVAVHDAARPLASPGLVDELLELLRAAGPDGPAGVVPGVPVIDTVRRVGQGGRSLGVVDRDHLRAIQTPQLFVRAVLEEAHQRAARDGIEATDEAALVERTGHQVRVVPGAVENLKVTTTLDLAVAEAILTRRAAGLAPGRAG